MNLRPLLRGFALEGASIRNPSGVRRLLALALAASTTTTLTALGLRCATSTLAWVLPGADASGAGLASTLTQFVVAVLPGLALAALGAACSKRSFLTRQSRALLCISAVAALSFWGSASGVRPAASGDAPVEVDFQTMRSGEVQRWEDGWRVRRPMPSRRAQLMASVAEAVSEALRTQRAQVILMFTRQGCPWCDRQVPVFHRALQNRSKDIAEAAAIVAEMEVLSIAGMGGTSISRLRVFFLDASEVPELARSFRIEAFPTSVLFCPKGGAPVVVKGFLGDDDLQELLRAVALMHHSRDEGLSRNRQWFFR